MNTLLATAQALGLFWILLLFALCFFAVHAVKLFCVGWQFYRKKETPPPKPKAEEEKAPVSQEPIYYIVERKRRRPKPAPRTTYGEPKQISFKP